MDTLSKSNQNLIDIYNKGYRIIDGNINYKGKIIIPTSTNKKGYYIISVRNNNGGRCKILIHRIIGYQKYGNELFKKGLMLRHLNGNNKDNSYDNIVIGTNYDNAMDIPIKIRRERGSKGNKLYDHEAIINMRKEGKSYKQLMKLFNISSKGTIAFILNKSMQLEKNNKLEEK